MTQEEKIYNSNQSTLSGSIKFAPNVKIDTKGKPFVFINIESQQGTWKNYLSVKISGKDAYLLQAQFVEGIEIMVTGSLASYKRDIGDQKVSQMYLDAREVFGLNKAPNAPGNAEYYAAVGGSPNGSQFDGPPAVNNQQPTYNNQPAPQQPAYNGQPDFNNQPAPQQPVYTSQPMYNNQPAPQQPMYNNQPAPQQPMYNNQPAPQQPAYGQQTFGQTFSPQQPGMMPNPQHTFNPNMGGGTGPRPLEVSEDDLPF